MQVVIICGGKGTRLKKIYKSTPKALIKFNNKPNLGYQINKLKKNNINDFLFLKIIKFYLINIFLEQLVH